ncbi:MAG: hypothetical protein HC905_26690 [Bacteroidales bacterium]|nr:hypothetical protein [Bacteroidales bacterium]
MVKDINTGLVSSNPKHFYIQNNMLLFIATDELHGTEIWCTDGTEAGTFIAGEVNPGALSSLKDPEVFEFASEFDSQILFFGKDNDLLFPATDPSNGQQIWKLSLSDLKNNAPKISGSINDTSLVMGTQLQYKIPVFSFDDPNDYLSYVATLEDGNPLPEWLKFNEATLTFTGIPSAAECVNVKITAFDRGNLSVSNQFTISVISNPSEVDQLVNQAYKVFPNPAKDYLYVELKDEMNPYPLITISDMQGKELIKYQSTENISKIDFKIIDIRYVYNKARY